MKTLVIVPSKQRPEVFEKYTKPFITNLGLDSLLILEKEDYKNYNFYNKLELKESNQRLGYALLQGKKYAEKHGYDLIFKIDDDVKEIGNVKKDLEKIYKQLHKYPKGATRHTIVYYSLQQMWSCLPLNEEILRARKRRDETELNRRNGIIPNQK